ncbi:MAG: DUF4440 domain-containing protein [Balneolaceae bacterium]
MEKQSKKEIIDIHRFFEAWLNGRMPKSGDELSALDCRLDDRFLMVSPSGRISDKAGLMENLMQAHGSWSGEEIWIENMECRYNEGGLCLMMYEEWQGRRDGEKRGRLSTVLFRVDGGTPIWVHLHEVWLPDKT